MVHVVRVGEGGDGVSATLTLARRTGVPFDALGRELRALLPRGGTAFVSTPSAWHACRIDGGEIVRRDGSHVTAGDAPFDVRAFDGDGEVRWRRDGDGGVAAYLSNGATGALPDGWMALPAEHRVTTVLEHTYRAWGTVQECNDGWALVHEERTGPIWIPVTDAAPEGSVLVLDAREFLGHVVGPGGSDLRDGMVVSIEEILTRISTGG